MPADYYRRYLRFPLLLDLGRRAPIKKTGKCAVDGFVKMQQIIIAGDMPSCASCQEVLLTKKFKQGVLSKELEDDKISPDVPDAIQGEAASEVPEENPEKPSDTQRQGRAEMPLTQAEVEYQQDFHKYKGDPWAYVKDRPEIVVLPAGSFGKKLPFRCTICLTRRNPQGKVGDMVCASFRSVRHFVKQHVESNYHVERLKENADTAGPIVAEVECQGLAASSFFGFSITTKWFVQPFSVGTVTDFPFCRNLSGRIYRYWHIGLQLPHPKLRYVNGRTQHQ